jgi:hypothetical protein
VLAVWAFGCAAKPAAQLDGAAAAALMAPAAPEVTPEYRIQIGDELHVRFT